MKIEYNKLTPTTEIDTKGLDKVKGGGGEEIKETFEYSQKNLNTYSNEYTVLEIREIFGGGGRYLD